MTKLFDCVLFDFDGTFADSGEGIFKGIQQSLEDMGEPLLFEAQLRTFIGPPLSDSFVRECDFDEEKTSRALSLYRKYYNDGLYKQLRVYDGMIELISKLKANGIVTAVASSKPEMFLLKILAHLECENLFDIVCGAGAEVLHVDANKTQIIQRAVDLSGISDKSKILMVGDRCFDVNGSKSVGIKCAGVLFGYGSQEELEDAGAAYIVQNTRELSDLILK